MSQVAHHQISTSPPDSIPNYLNNNSTKKFNHQQQKQQHLNHIKSNHAKSFSLDPTNPILHSILLPNSSSLSQFDPISIEPPISHSHSHSIPFPSSSTSNNSVSSNNPLLHPSVSSFHFPLLHLSSPTPPPADKTDYFDQTPTNNPTKPSRPLHQKAQSETAMRLELPRSLPSSSHIHNLPMLRKKSGEVVRSSLKLFPNSPRHTPTPSYASTRSAPSTPTSGPKAVHFDSHLEHVRHFLSQQRPMAVSRDGSPIETETEGEDEYPFPDMGPSPDGIRWNPSSPRTKLIIELLNMPLTPRPPSVVCLKSIELSQDGKNLQGSVQVQNLSFEKRVAVRFTLDKWQTVSEVTAEYLSSSGLSSNHSDPKESVDLFGFTIKLQDVLARIDEREMEIAIRYLAAGGEYWDNNSNANYHVKFKHLRTNYHPPNNQKHSSEVIHPPLPPVNSSPKVPPSSNNESCPWAVTLRAELDRLVGDDLGLATSNPSGIKKKFSNSTSGPTGWGGVSGVARIKPGTGLSARYDFSSSLKQATLNFKQPSNRSNRFDLSLPHPVTPVPIEWLGVMPITSDTENRRHSTHLSSCTLDPCSLESEKKENQDTSLPRGNYKRWTLPGMPHLPNLPPSPPQESPTVTQTKKVVQLPLQQRPQQEEEIIQKKDDGLAKNDISKSSEPALLLSNQQGLKIQQHDLSPHNQSPSFLNFHRPCPSGLVTPESPTLTDDSA